MTRQPPLPVIETPRLALHRLSTDDAGFILELLNEPSFLRYIGDKGVRTREDAGRYILGSTGWSGRTAGSRSGCAAC